jgi:hypothetical protein
MSTGYIFASASSARLLAAPTDRGQLQTVLLGILMLPVIGADFCHH